MLKWAVCDWRLRKASFSLRSEQLTPLIWLKLPDACCRSATEAVLIVVVDRLYSRNAGGAAEICQSLVDLRYARHVVKY